MTLWWLAFLALLGVSRAPPFNANHRLGGWWTPSDTFVDNRKEPASVTIAVRRDCELNVKAAGPPRGQPVPFRSPRLLGTRSFIRETVRATARERATPLPSSARSASAIAGTRPVQRRLAGPERPEDRNGGGVGSQERYPAWDSGIAVRDI